MCHCIHDLIWNVRDHAAMSDACVGRKTPLSIADVTSRAVRKGEVTDLRL
ncbi:hypothetical protein J2803_004077 [Paraburkholderia phenoliruptrix]|nr:hypothetical protein [Paraburkholderia phenoliruptrix]